MTQDFHRQLAEFQIRAAVLNGFAALGIYQFPVLERSVHAEGRSGDRLICTTPPVRWRNPVSNSITPDQSDLFHPGYVGLSTAGADVKSATCPAGRSPSSLVRLSSSALTATNPELPDIARAATSGLSTKG